MAINRAVKVGDTCNHLMSGKLWTVRITGLGKSKRDVREADEWEGVIAGDQHGLNDGDVCWGRISELEVR